MTDVSSLEAYAGQMSEAATKSTALAGIHHQVVHGDAQTDVLTESGPLASLAKQAVQAQSKVTASLAEVASQLAGAMTYGSTAKGLEGTNNGGYFSVPSSESDEYLILYENRAGLAWDTGKRYPSTEAVEAIAASGVQVAARVAETEGRTKNIWSRKVPRIGFAILDRLGGLGQWLDEHGVSQSLASNTRRHLVNGVEQITQIKRRIFGTCWALFGSDGRALVALRNDGTVVMAKLTVKELLVNGEPYTKNVGAVNLQDLYRRGSEVLKFHANPLTVSGWGSSSMERMASQFASMTADLAPMAVYYSGGKGGEQSTHIAARLGSIPMLATVADGSIPASGAVTVMVSNVKPSSSMKPFTGWLNGIYGTMSSTGSVITFTRSVAGIAVATTGEFPFIPEIGPQHRGGVTFLWMGKNDAPGYSAESIIARTDATFDWLSPSITRCLVLGHFHDSNTAPDSAEALILDAVNAAHKKRYGELFVDVQAYLMSPQVWIDTGITPTAGDLAQQALGQKPASLSADTGHLSAAMYAVLNTKVLQPLIRQLGWY